MGRSRATGTRGGKGKAKAAASASKAAGGSTTRKRKAAASASEAAAGGSGVKRKKQASSSEERKITSEERKILRLKREEDRNILRLKREERKILRLKKEEDRKILRLKKEEARKIRRVKSEEGKILKLKKEYTAAEDEAMANLPAAYRPTPPVKAAEPAGKKKKTVLVKRLVAQQQIDALLALPRSIIPNELTEEQLAGHSQTFRDIYNKETNIVRKLRNYHQALVDQYFKYGFAVDESEAEVTDDEYEDDDS